MRWLAVVSLMLVSSAGLALPVQAGHGLQVEIAGVFEGCQTNVVGSYVFGSDDAELWDFQISMIPSGGTGEGGLPHCGSGAVGDCTAVGSLNEGFSMESSICGGTVLAFGMECLRHIYSGECDQYTGKPAGEVHIDEFFARMYIQPLLPGNYIAAVSSDLVTVHG